MPSTPKRPVKTQRIPTNRDREAVNAGTSGGPELKSKGLLFAETPTALPVRQGRRALLRETLATSLADKRAISCSPSGQVCSKEVFFFVLSSEVTTMAGRKKHLRL